jgi:peptide/nickel transport system substrate-binding protein
VRQVYDTLVDFSRDFSRAVPRLATSWSVSDGGRTYTFVLRRGVRFHTGRALTAADVEFSLRRVFRLKLAPAFILTDFVKSPEDIVAVGADRIRVAFNQVMPEVLMASVMANPVTSVVDRMEVQRRATADDPLANRWLSTNDAGSGPFRLAGWSRNVKIELVAFDDYWAGRPKLGRIFMQEIPDPAAQQLALQRGDIDAAMSLLPGQYRQLRGQAGIVVKTSPTFSLRYLAMNVGYEPFAKKEVRNAVKWAIDYDAIVRIWEEAIDPGQTIVPARMFGHLPDRPFRRNPDRARALLREGGYERGFRAELLTVPDPPLPDVAAKMKEDLAQVGIQVEVRQLRSADLLGIYRAQRHQMVIARWGADYPDPDNLAKAFADFDSQVLAWRNQWDHPVKRIVRTAVQELDRAKREALYKEIQRVVLDEGPYVVFAYPLRQIAMWSNVKGLDPSPLDETYGLADVWKD